MSLKSWRDAWLCLGMTAAAAHAEPAPVSVLDAPPLAGATYVVRVGVDPDPFGSRGAVIALERGTYHCGSLLEALHPAVGLPTAEILATASKTCDLALGLGLDEALYGAGGGGDDRDAVVVVDDAGKRLTSADDVLHAALPIDTPAKALLAVWLTRRYAVTWYAAPAKGVKTGAFHGGPEDGHVRQVADGFEVDGALVEAKCTSERKNEKTVTTSRVTLRVDAQGKIAVVKKVVVETAHEMCVVQYGRRPEGFCDVAPCETVEDHLRRAGHHEAESVRAFERIARELAAFGAPAELVAAAEEAADQERAHAARIARLLAEPVAIARDALPLRDLFAFAIDNAREGCVGEAYAALANVVQARAAGSPVLRAHFAAIAADELGHAALAHAIADWAATRLTAGERAVVHAVRARALTALGEAAAASSAPALLGLPSGTATARLVVLVAQACS